jgi:hypothetical protein
MLASDSPRFLVVVHAILDALDAHEEQLGVGALFLESTMVLIGSNSNKFL